MASNQKTSQHKRPKTTTHNCFLACFGFHPKTYNNTTSSSSYKKKPKKFGVRKKFFFKLCWPKFKVITIDNNNKSSSNNNMKKKKNKKMQNLEVAKTAAFKASHNFMLEAATKVHHQFKTIDHHHAPKSITTQEPIAVLKESTHQDQQSRCSKSQSSITTCNTEDNGTPKATMVKQPLLLANKTTKDSVIGASIMVAMVIIMSIWGRLCAILCMCGWLYCVPLIRGDREVASSKSNDTDDTEMGVDFNSELYKKKVVLDGLLQRDHQDAVGIS